jgi:hypothetical protein
VTRSGSTYTLYLNGLLVASDISTFSIPDLVVPLTVGKAEGVNLDGVIDEVEMFHRALSGSEIQAIFTAGSAGKCKGFTFSGFFPPVSNPPVLNVVKAGQAIPVKFSLDGYQGLNIFATGYPRSQQVDCNTAATNPIDETVTAGGSSLTYDPSTDQYTYVWKTDTRWADTCRQLVVRLIDGSNHVANFRFK